jgi:hypothetical protein
VLLEVIGPHAAAELTLYDSQRKVLARGVGKLEQHLQPGLYQAEAAMADGAQRKIIAIEPGNPGPKYVVGWSVEFASAAPLDQTWTSHEYQMEPAVKYSQQPTWAWQPQDRTAAVWRP